MRRLVYAPEVTAYIQTEKETVNVSNDIISGSVTRRTDAPSSAQLTLQNRNMFYIGRFKPMDRIVIFLKKVQPILVFSGYLDSVPFLQPIPEPVTITATCSLKRLEFTYWDPGLPNIQLIMAEFLGGPGNDNTGAIPGIGGGDPLRFFDQRKNGKVEDIGFGRMLHFLVEQVGKFPRDKTHVLPIPPNWIESAAKIMAQNFEAEKDQRELNERILSMILTSPGGSSGAGGTLNNVDPAEIGLNSKQLSGAQAIIKVYREYNLNPATGIAVALSESNLEPDAVGDNGNSFGLFQLNRNGALGSLTPEQAKDPEVNAGVAARAMVRLGAVGKSLEEQIRIQVIDFERPADPAGRVIKDQANAPRALAIVERLTSGGGSGTAGGRRETFQETDRRIGRENRTAVVDGLRPSGGWGGSEGPIKFLENLVLPLGLTVNNNKRNNQNPFSGSNSDHDFGQKNSYASDLNFGSNEPNERGDRAASIIYKALADAGGQVTHRFGSNTDPDNWGKTGGNVTFILGSLRFQLIYRCAGGPCGGNHLNHIHIGCRNNEPGAVGTPSAGSNIPQTTSVRNLEFFNPMGDINYSIVSTPAGHASRPFNNWQSDVAYDLGAEPGTPIFAAFDGTITRFRNYSGPDPASGNPYGGSLTLKSSARSDIYAFYTHFKNSPVSQGATVKAGDILGYILDHTSVPAHLHFAMGRSADGAVSNGVDPTPFLEATKGKSTPTAVGIAGASLTDPREVTTSANGAGAFNAVFNFPGDPLESILLRGQRALMNDVKLLQSIQEVASAGLRTFASHPNGDFMAWFPDYFNTSGISPYLSISENELVNCTIEMSDTNLATHVFVTGNTLGTEGIPIDFWQKLTSFGVVNIEQAYLLDTFLSKGERKVKTFEELTKAGLPNPKQLNKKSRRLLADNAEIYRFLNRYGARPYALEQPSIRHPLMEFFMAFQWFQRKWAEQFSSNVEFTFMPELFPGTIVHLQSLNVNFYCSEVTHSFDYSSGFTTTATLQAPSTNAGHNFGMALVGPPYKKAENETPPPKPAIKKPKKPKKPPKPPRDTGGGAIPNDRRPGSFGNR